MKPISKPVPCPNDKMTTEEFVRLRADYLRKLLRVYYGRHWRQVTAKRLGRADVPRWLFASGVPTTLRSMKAVEEWVLHLQCRLGCPKAMQFSQRCPPNCSSFEVAGICPLQKSPAPSSDAPFVIRTRGS